MATSKEWAQVIAKAWLDEDFKNLLEKNPRKALKQCGFKVDKGVFEVMPRPADLTDEEIREIAEGKKTAYHCTDKTCCP